MIPTGRWQHISQLYQAALERPANERSTFLDEVCAGDEALRREVEWLLAQERTAEGSLAAPTLEAAAKVMRGEAAPPLIGRHLGA